LETLLASSQADFVNHPRTVLVCQHRSCRKRGSADVLAAFLAAVQSKASIDIEIQPVQCLGECGNGAMVLILPEQVWYDRVQPDEVPAIVERHLNHNQPIQAMLYKKFLYRFSSRRPQKT
jgi:(2Fe-2S) ferredoxin